ncbi:MAG TPA: hypothetical protein VFC56_15605, partial [Stellaceae bacterium]|nr:hypothetical protein [Stellaceae bacterium]
MIPSLKRIAAAPVINALASLPRWVAWREDTRPGKSGSNSKTKVPYRPGSGPARTASSTDPTTWGTMAEAHERARTLPRAGGVGVVLGALGDGHALCGIDLDSCRDPE